jgi:hypothetical protein
MLIFWLLRAGAVAAAMEGAARALVVTDHLLRKV